MHLHRLHRYELVVLGDLRPDAHREAGDDAGNGCGHFQRIGRVGLHAALGLGRDTFVLDVGLARHAVQLERDGAPPVLVRSADVHELDEERLALLNAHADFLVRLEPVEKGVGGQQAHLAEIALDLGEVSIDLGIHQVAVKVVVRGIPLQLGSQLLAHFLQVHRRHVLAGPDGDGLLLAEDDFLQLRRPSAHGLAKSAGKHVDDAGREWHTARFKVHHVSGFDAARDEEHGHVTHDLAAGRDLDDVAEEFVDLGVGAGDFTPAACEPHAGGLLLEVGVLAAGHFVQINLGGTCLGRGVERAVIFTHRLPVVGELIQRLKVQPGVARRVLERGHDAVQVRLARAAAHAGECEIHYVHARLGGVEDGSGLHAAGVVRVEVDGQANLLFQRLDQLLRGEGTAQAGHVLDGDHVRAQLFQLLGQSDVVFEGILVALWIKDVARVADGSFTDGVGIIHGRHRHAEIRRVVQRVEHPEDVHAGRGSVLHEAGHDIVRIVGVSDGVAAAEQHLEADVRNLAAQLAQTLPRILVQKAHRGVEGRAAPHLQREQPRRAARERIGHREHVGAADPRGHQALVRIAKGRVCDEQPLLLAGPVGELFRPQFEQQVACSGRRCLPVVVVRRHGRGEGLLRLESLGVRIAIHNDVAEEVQELRGAVPAVLEGEQLRRVVNQGSRRLPAAEHGVVDQVFEERNVGLHPANAEFSQRAVRPLKRHLIGLPRAGDLHEHRVVERRDHRASKAHPAIQPHPKAARAAIGEDLAVVRRELAFRILSRDAALHGVTVAGNLILRRHPDLGAVQAVALGDEDLRAHQIQARDDLRDRVLDLDARIHLNEEPLVPVEIVEELNGARVIVANLAGHPRRRSAQLLDDVLGQAEGRRDLNNLLMPPLHRAIALVQVDHIAMLVAKNLHLDVLRVGDVFLQEHRRIAKRPARLRLRLVEQVAQVRRLVDHAHPATTATEGRLDDERETDLFRHLQRISAVADGVLGARQRGHPDLLRQRPGRRFVAHHLQQLGPGADERDARGRTGAREGGVLRKKAVTGMDQIHAAFLRQRDDALNVQVGADRPLPLPHQIRLVGLEAMHTEAVLLRVNCDGAQAQFGRGAENADGDLGPIRRHQLHKCLRGRRGFGVFVAGRLARAAAFTHKRGRFT